MINKAIDKDLIMTEVLANPISANEVLFSNMDNLIEFNEKYSQVRKYQIPFLNFAPLFIYDKSKSKKENFEIKRGFAESYALGGRLTGKSHFGIKTDVPIQSLWKTFQWAVISSLDKLHLTGVIETIISIFTNHPIFSLLNAKPIKSPNYRIDFPSGILVESVNNNLKGKNPGEQWFQKHMDLNYEEEASFLTDKITNKKLMSKSELGVIRRYSGMTTFSRTSPLGNIFYDPSNRNKIANIPSYANPNYTDADEKDAIQEFDGKESLGYKIQIKGKVMDECDCPYDIEKIENCYREDYPIKTFELGKDNFRDKSYVSHYTNILIFDKPKNAGQTIIATDIGEGSAPTEIIIIFKIAGKYKYAYNITAVKISPDNHYELFRFIINEILPNLIGIDYTSGVGKALYSNLAKDYQKHLVAVSFNEKILIDFERNPDGEIKLDENNKPIPKYERTDIWSVQRIKHIFYNELIEMPMDYKFHKQISNVVVLRTKDGADFKYDCKVKNHIYQAFQVFAITVWNETMESIKPIQKKKMSLGVFN